MGSERPPWDRDEFEGRYDFTESVILDVRWNRLFRDLEIKVDYCWDLSDPSQRLPASREQPVIIRLVDCVWVSFDSGRRYIESDLEFSPQIMTIIGWSIDSDVGRDLGQRPELREHLQHGYHYVYFATSYEPGKTWAQIICRAIEVQHV